MLEVTRLHLAYRQRLARLRDAALGAVTRADEPTDAAQVVLAVQREVVALADGYLSLEAGLSTGSDTDPWGIDPEPLIGRSARRGVFLEEVYARNWAVPIGTFASRMTREVHTDLSLADRAASFVHSEGDSRIVGTRRVLGAGPNCALCVVAATQRYGKDELRPIHRGCGCSTAPIYGVAASWKKPSKAALNDLYQRAGGTDFRSLRTLTVNEADLPPGVNPADLGPVGVVDAPELGPSLVGS